MAKYTKQQRAIRAEYRRYRDIINRRISALEKAGFGATEFVTKNKGRFAAISTLTQKQVEQNLARIKAALQYSGSTVTGAKFLQAKAVLSLQKAGYNITPSNIAAFGRFMEKFRATYGKRAYGSDKAAALFDTIESAGYSSDEIMQDFELFYENEKKVKALIRSERGITSDEIREALQHQNI